jgi:hypothetical protein
LPRALERRTSNCATQGRQFTVFRARAHKLKLTRPLPSTPEALWSAVDRKVRNQGTKAQKDGLTAQAGHSELIADFYTVFSRNMRDLGTPCIQRACSMKQRACFHTTCTCTSSVGTRTCRRRNRTPFKDIVIVPWASSLREHRSTARTCCCTGRCSSTRRSWASDLRLRALHARCRHASVQAAMGRHRNTASLGISAPLQSPRCPITDRPTQSLRGYRGLAASAVVGHGNIWSRHRPEHPLTIESASRAKVFLALHASSHLFQRQTFVIQSEILDLSSHCALCNSMFT